MGLPLDQSSNGDVGRLEGGEKGEYVASGDPGRDKALLKLERSGEMGRIRVRSQPEMSAAEMMGTSWYLPMPSSREVKMPPDDGDPASLGEPAAAVDAA